MSELGGFADFYGQSSVNPVALGAVIIIMVTQFFVPRRWVLPFLLIAACTIPMAQRIVIFGADFTLLRVLLLGMLIRVLCRRESIVERIFIADWMILGWTCAGVVIFTIQFGTISAFVNRLGWAYDIVLTYFLTRFLIRSPDDLLCLAKSLALASIPLACLFIFESLTRYNVFHIFGGIEMITPMREGRLRCQGPFAHPILAGTFWVSSLQIIWFLYGKDSASKNLAHCGTIASLFIIFACASSTPIIGALFSLLLLLLYPFRNARHLFWFLCLASLIMLHLIMDKPVWHLMARAGIVGGSTGWHRYIIFDAFVKHIDKWFLLGEPNPTDWGVWQMRDITNHFMKQGLQGGIWSLSFFIGLIVFLILHTSRALDEPLSRSKPAYAWIVWLAGGAIITHMVTFFGISYFGQMTSILYVQFGVATCVLSIARTNRDKKVESIATDSDRTLAVSLFPNYLR